MSIVLVVALSISCVKQEKDAMYQVASPNAKNNIKFELQNGVPTYSVSHGDKSVLNTSDLGFIFKNNDSLSSNFEVLHAEETAFDETWEQVWGEKHHIRNHYNQLSVTLQETSKTKRQLEIQFRAFNDGIAFRYVYPEQGKDSIVIIDELTSFNIANDGDAWWIPAYKTNRYEHLFTKSGLSTLDTVHTPLTIKSNNGLYLSFHEADLKDFASYTIAHKSGTHFDLDLMPWSNGDKVRTNSSFNTPWRTLQIGEKPGDLIESYIVLNLNEPNKLEDTSWIENYKYLGVWWGMHISKYSFWEGPNHGASTKISKEYIDDCKKLGIHHLLIEGWNKGWTPAWYENKMHVFSFTEATDDFNLKEVTDYARDNDVKIIGYHETGSNIINYRKQIDAGMKLYQDMGINDVKIGQVGDKLNMKEWHGSQFGVQYYREVLEKAAKYKLTVNFHEPIKATGERRTYPNMMAREGARGQEYNAWSDGNPPSHTVTLPFTRMLAGPMDFTPGVIDVLETKGFNNRRVHTTAAKQLALYVTMYSPIQMLADLPENYIGKPEFQFLADVPTDWEDTKVLNAEIGEYITTVRKDLKSDDWYLGSMTNENTRDLEIDLSFLGEGTFEAQIYADAEGTDLENNPASVGISTKKVTATDKMTLKLPSGGGTAIRFKKI
ncbi:glycoside hydrolase family 97 protein [Thalassobellus suaedae]|uniref:Glycoside hydrolase family 97 protein n=1 Tax=Thalassobellus suaedae TaxID=3074124 RepID=A0ABY9XZZ7_9FLAO|nr:glycoside hydrolase family 97 protein [Flavobacteriaceae bacterium HL-DH10]